MATSSPSSPTEASVRAASAECGGSAHPAVMQWRKDTSIDLYQAYISVFTDGGLFMQTRRDDPLGQERMLLFPRCARLGTVPYVY